MKPADPNNLDFGSGPGGDELDRLLKGAAESTREKAPAGFVGSVMDSIARQDTILEAKPPLGRNRWVPFAVAAAAALLLGTFLLGGLWGGRDRKDAAEGGAGPLAHEGDGRAPGASRPRDAAPHAKTPAGDPNAGDITEEMRRGAGNARGGHQESAKPEGEDQGSRKDARDRARLSLSAPGTLAGRFPRSADGRFYVVIDLTLAELPSLQSVLSQENGDPKKNAAAGLPALVRYSARLVRLPAPDGEKLLAKLQASHPDALRPHLLGFEGLAPVNGVITPPRVESPDSKTGDIKKNESGSAEGESGSRPGAASQSAKSIAGEDLVEIVVYTLAK